MDTHDFVHRGLNWIGPPLGIIRSAGTRAVVISNLRLNINCGAVEIALLRSQ